MDCERNQDVTPRKDAAPSQALLIPGRLCLREYDCGAGREESSPGQHSGAMLPGSSQTLPELCSHSLTRGLFLMAPETVQYREIWRRPEVPRSAMLILLQDASVFLFLGVSQHKSVAPTLSPHTLKLLLLLFLCYTAQ